MRKWGREKAREKIDKKSKRKKTETEKGLEAEGKFQLSPWTRLCQAAKQ